MPDWRELIEERLCGLALEPDEEAEIIVELATHLEETCQAMICQGVPEEEAVRETLAHAGDWRDVQRRIASERKGRPFMKKRFQQLWIPGFLSMVLYAVFLIGLQRIGFHPHVAWLGSRGIVFFTSWLLVLLLVGGLGSFVSSRAGGSRGSSIFASVFPALAMTTALLLMFPIGWALGRITEKPVGFGPVATGLLHDAIGWLALPAITLFVGGLLAQFLLARRAPSRDAAIV